MTKISFSGIRKIPFVRILIPFLIGDLMGLFLSKGILWTGVFFIGGMIFYLFGFSGKSPGTRYTREWIGGIGIMLWFISLGLFTTILNTFTFGEKSNFEGNAVVVGDIFKPAIIKKNNYQVEVIVRGVRKDSDWIKVHGKALLYFGKNSKIFSEKSGETILFHTHLNPFPFYHNPGEFDYRRYQNDHGVYWQAFVKKGSWRMVPGKSSFSLSLKAKKVQLYLVNCLKKYGFSQSSLAIASALTTGDRDFLDPRTKKYFADSGTMHILAISGLHVGIIYFVSLYLFSFFGKSRHILLIRLIFILWLLWSYAFITGLSPSVMRAALMFSLLLIGQSFQRKTNVYNILAVSAFILLVIHPVWIRDAGFQLSYMAVLGIVALYRPLYHFAATGIWWFDKIWSLLVVSIAAIAGTFPLTLYYFHRFPLYAPLTNLLVIPMVTLFIYAGMVFFLMQPFPWLAGMMAQMMKALSKGLLLVAQKSLTLPAAVISPVWLHRSDVGLLYVLVLAVFLLFMWRKPAFILLLQVIFLTGVIFFVVRETETIQKKRLVVFNIPHSSVFLLSSGKNAFIGGNIKNIKSAYYLKDIKEVLSIKKLLPAYSGFHPELWEKSKQDSQMGIYLGKGFFKTGSLTGYFLNDSTKQRLKEKISVDCLVFSGRKWWQLEQQLTTIHPRIIILDSSVPEYVANKIRALYREGEIYAVREQGPFIWEE